MSSNATTADRRRGSPASVALIVVGSLIGLLALALLAGGGGLLWADKTQRDSAGYFTTTSHRFSSATYALTHEGVNVDDVPGWLDTGKLATVRIRATAADSEQPLFVGIAPEGAVTGYLAGTAHTRLTDLDFDPFSATYERVPGSERPARPASRHLWVASASGRGETTVTWPVREGNWSVVVMKADASRAVAADVSFGADVHYLGWITVGLFGGGGILLALAVLLVALGARRVGDGGGEPSPSAPAAPASGGSGAPPATVYPAAIAGRLDEPLSRWLWVVKWLLALPHAIVLAFLWVAFVLATIAAWFAILFTGRYPRGIFDFNVGVLRWTWRVAFYATSAIGTDRYPPFSLREEPDYPATLSVEYPERLSRGLVLVKSWLLAIPHLLVVGIFGGGLWFAWDDEGWSRIGGSGLLGLLVLIAGVVLLFTGRYPRSIYDFVLGLDRWIFRVAVYVGLMRDEYPPFRLDMGGEEPPQPQLSPPAVPAGA